MIASTAGTHLSRWTQAKERDKENGKVLVDVRMLTAKIRYHKQRKAKQCRWMAHKCGIMKQAIRRAFHDFTLEKLQRRPGLSRRQID
jgi:CRISPR/Cas system CSM-associated protein Csm2 small subunit